MEEKNDEIVQVVEKEEIQQDEEIIYEECEKDFKPRTYKKLLLIIAVITILLVLFSTIFAVVNLGNDKIIRGIYIGEIEVSNMTKEEAKSKLEEIYSAKKDIELYFKYDKHETSITYEALEVNYQIEQAVNEALRIGRDGNLFKDNFDILSSLIFNKKIEVGVQFDKETLSQIIQNINNTLENALVQPSYYIKEDKLIITTGKSGKILNEGLLIKELYKCLNSNDSTTQEIVIKTVDGKPEEIDIEKIHEDVYKKVQDAYYEKNPFKIYVESDGIDFDIENAKTILAEEKEEYEIPLIITKPTKTVEQIGTEAFPDLLTTFSTKYDASNKNRTTNLRLAAGKVNGTVLLPGEEFSYNKTVGERTVEAGFKSAAIFSGGKVVDGLGGGICQISSTLYDAVVFANLTITERRNHQFVTSYLPAGKDATVVWGSQDFKFKNTRSYPIRIEATVEGGVAKVNIWGVKEEVEYDISIETKKTATINYTTQYIEDPTLPVGTEVVVQAGNSGRKVEAYKVMKLNGQIVSTTLLSKDTYNPMKRIVRIGTAQ